MKLRLLVSLLLILSVSLTAQDMSYEVMTVETRSIDLTQLHQAANLNDIHPGFPKSWIQDYESVKISATINGEVREATGSDDLLTLGQKDLLQALDWGSAITVKVDHIADNPITKEPVHKEIKFSYTVGPTKTATYGDHYTQLKAYLKVAAIDKIVDLSDLSIQSAEVRFIVDNQGIVGHVYMFQSSKNEKVDQLLLDAINNMTQWTPAQTTEGQNMAQEFKLTIGGLQGC